MTGSLLDRLDRLNHEATPGPWDVDWNGPLTAIHASDGSGKHVAKTAGVPDAALIVEMRNALPALLEAVRAAQRLDAEQPMPAVGKPGFAHRSRLRAALAGLVGDTPR